MPTQVPQWRQLDMNAEGIRLDVPSLYNKARSTQQQQPIAPAHALAVAPQPLLSGSLLRGTAGQPCRGSDQTLPQVVKRARGGYSFELNTLFAALLTGMGYTVRAGASRIVMDGLEVRPWRIPLARHPPATARRKQRRCLGSEERACSGLVLLSWGRSNCRRGGRRRWAPGDASHGDWLTRCCSLLAPRGRCMDEPSRPSRHEQKRTVNATLQAAACLLSRACAGQPAARAGPPLPHDALRAPSALRQR